MINRINCGLAAALVGAALLTAGQASAHAQLLASTPAANATVPPPTKITLTYDEKLTPAFSGFDLTMTGHNMRIPVKTALSKDRKSITAVLKAPLMAGAYSLTWRAAAVDDGHRTDGAFVFTVK